MWRVLLLILLIVAGGLGFVWLDQVPGMLEMRLDQPPGGGEPVTISMPPVYAVAGALVLAVALLKKGVDVKVYERDLTAIRGEGKYRGPIQVQSNALAALEAIDAGVCDAVLAATQSIPQQLQNAALGDSAHAQAAGGEDVGRA
jgi:uncharacterized membrane-anchored protein